MRIIWRAVCPDCPYISRTVIPAEAGIQKAASALKSWVHGHDTMRPDEDRDANGVVPLPVCGMAHRHTRGGGYPEDGISLEIVYLRA